MSRQLSVVLLSLIALLLAACGGGAKETITLVENDWPSSNLNVNVAKIIIEQEMGNTVEIVSLDESAQWDALVAGDADASLEVWPSGHLERIAEYINANGVVNNGGMLGPSGEIGWYVPTYMVSEYPELATWEGFADPELAGLFASAETGENGRFLSSAVGRTQNDEAIIENLGLPLQVVWADSEEALLAEVSSAISREEPILFYFYSPHAIFNTFDLTAVQLPAYTDACYAQAAADINCGYPVDDLMKIISPSLQEKDPTVNTFLQNFVYSNADQIAMLSALDEGLSVEEVAQQWVDNNEGLWQLWLP